MIKVTGYRKLLLVSGCAIAVSFATFAQAQVATYYDNNVMVDLSVLEDNGRNPVAPSYGLAPSSAMKHAPTQPLKSRLHTIPRQAIQQAAPVVAPAQPLVQPKSRILLRDPAVAAKAPTMPPVKPPKSQIATAAPKPMVKAAAKADPAPAPLPKPAPVVKVEAPKPVAPPQPVVKVEAPVEPVKKVVSAPAPKVEKVAETAKVEAPVEKVAEAPKLAPVSAPKTIAAAPPPPPTAVVEPKPVESAMKKEAAKEPVKTAALPTASEGEIRIAFEPGESQLPASVESELQAALATLKKNKDDRVQLWAYAGGENLSSSKARRLSLSRALAVRSYLIEKGVPSTRIDVRALGNKTTEEPFDRVEVKFATR